MKRNKSVLGLTYEVGSKDELTCFSGYEIIHSALKKFGVFDALKGGFGMKQRNRDYSEHDYFHTLLANFSTGGTVLDDINRLSEDKTFQQRFGFKNGIPTGNAVSKFLNHANETAVRKFQEINKETLLSILQTIYGSRKPAIRVLAFLDSSELEVYGKKFEGASKNYEGNKALRMHAIFLEDFLVSLRLYSPEGKYVTYGWEELLADLECIESVMKSEIHIMADSAYFDYEILNYIEKKGWKYSISLKKFSVFSEEAARIRSDEWINDYSSFEYTTTSSKEFYRVVVYRKEREPDLFDKYDYYCIMTNNRTLSAEQIFYRHSTKMGMENRFKDLLIDLNLHHPRQQSLAANQLYYQLAMLFYNIIKAIQYGKTKGHDFFLTIRSFLLKFIFIPGRFVKGGRKVKLRLAYFPGGLAALTNFLL